MNLFSLQVAQGDPKAVRMFIRAARRSKTHEEAHRSLGLTRTTYYRLLKKLRDEGNTL